MQLHLSVLASSSLVLAFFSRQRDIETSMRASSIPDDLNRELSNSFEPLHYKLNEISLRSSCFETAVRSLTIECNELPAPANEAIRTKFATALTLCELALAGQHGPPSCHKAGSEANIRQCIKSLETKSQWYVLVRTGCLTHLVDKFLWLLS